MSTYNGNSLPSNLKLADGDIINFEYSGSAKQITLPPGIYKLECWGAQGGTAVTKGAGGRGGYSVGTITSKDDLLLFVLVGGIGVSGNKYGAGYLLSGGFNGGGSGRDWSSASHSGAGGGGGTDIRTVSNNYKSRIIVAGGGGGSSDNGTGGVGGGLSGGTGTASNRYGSQTSGSAFGYATASSYTSGECGGGGGGWYGGTGGVAENDSGGGGSGYVFTKDTKVNYPSGCLLTDDHLLTDAKTIAGSASMPNPRGSGNITGNTGNGYGRITVIKANFNQILIDDNGELKSRPGSDWQDVA